MPPKEKYTKIRILEAAFELVRTEGFEQLSARNIAKGLGCSTQPIYSSFGSIENLEEELVEIVKLRAQEMILDYKDDESHFLSTGLGYFRFAQTEPKLFIGLFVNGRWKWNFSKEDPFFSPILERMRKDNFLAIYSDEKLAEIFRDMFIYTHGLATQSHLSADPITVESARELLKKMGGILAVSAGLEGEFSIENIMRSFHEWTD